ncbi:MAG TPA: FG-GAP-like repeat-containing protein [Lysobacter sp.]|nr:FG-GAP-like repeat-containing protein [Lysobacter sp.]
MHARLKLALAELARLKLPRLNLARSKMTRPKMTRPRLAAAALLLATASLPVPATFHLMKIVEIFPGTPAAPAAQYVVIQMYASGQNLVGGHQITVFNAAGTLVATFTFTSNVSNGANQAKILIATPQAEAFFGLNADLEMNAAIMAAGGKVCFADTIDCVAWGAYTGSPTGVGTPFNVGGGLASGRAAVRRLDIAGSATVLDAGDDTNNCATDFVSGLPAPRNNAGMLGTVPPATCGNGVLQGLEQCDDGNLVNGDGCSSTCMVTPVTRKLFDFNADGKSDILWRNSNSGANTIWLSANRATPQAVSAVTNLAWRVVGSGDYNGDGKADILWRNSSTGANAIWRSANVATPQAVATVGDLAWSVVGSGDYNGDGKADILWRNSNSGANAIWLSANLATPQAVSSVTNLAWRVVGSGDYNGDGKADILWRNSSTGANAIWRSANVATPQAVATVGDLAWSVVGSGN